MLNRIPANKYGAAKTELDGITFASRKEANRYAELVLMEKAHEITGLERQRKFTLIGAQRDSTGRVIERPCVYIADFVYKDKTGELVVEDIKTPATRTPQYVIKRKLMLSIYGIRVKEV